MTMINRLRTVTKALIIFTLFGLTLLLGLKFLDPIWGDNASGWVQTGIALVSFPVILYQINQLITEINKRPKISIGLININDLPFSNVRTFESLSQSVQIGSGYPLFYLVVRNSGTAPARHLKIYLEHINREANTQNVMAAPIIKVSEFSEDKPRFWKEHNWDFVFRAGQDWIINPDDIEPFGFYITTSIGTGETYEDKDGRTQHRMRFPEIGKIDLVCTVWAEGLEQPIKTKFFVEIIERI